MLSRNSRGSAREPAEHHVVKQGTANFTKSSKDSNQLKKLNEYTIQRKLGQGAYGQVFMASDERGETVAIKVINKSVLKRKSMGARGASALDTLAREIAVMKKINHPHCVQLYEVIDDPKDEKLYLVMELLTGGEVAASLDVPPQLATCDPPPSVAPPFTLCPVPCALRATRPHHGPAAPTRQAMHKDNLPPEQEHLPENAARQVFRDLLVGLEYLHAQGILHRDLKPENLVFQAAPDYGRARSASTSGRGSPRTFFLRNSSARASSARASSSRDSTSSRDSSSSRPSSASRPSLRGLASLAPWRRASTSHHGASTSTKLQHAEAEAPWCEVVQEVGAGGGSGGGTGHGSGHGARDGQTGEASLQATLPGGILHAHGAGGEFSGVAPAEGGRPAAAARRRWSLCGGRRDRGGGGAGEAGVAAADPSLVRHAPRIKLLDFGVAAICREHEALEALEVAGGSGTPCTQPDARRDGVPAVRQDDSLLKTSGTPAFYAPEMCVKGAYHGAPCPARPPPPWRPPATRLPLLPRHAQPPAPPAAQAAPPTSGRRE
jgi:serine/threonine protein kinase